MILGEVKKIKKAFTIIELLVVIAIVGILATLVVVSLNSLRSSAGDAKRLADVRQIQNALELYYDEESRYPATEEFSMGKQLKSPSSFKIIMHKIPLAPAFRDGDCQFDGYEYVAGPDGSSYALSFCIGDKTSELSGGDLLAFPGGIKNIDHLSDFSCGDLLSDTRDGNYYETIKIGEQCWMAENLRYLPEVHDGVDFSDRGLNKAPAYGVYDYEGSSVNEAKLTDNYSVYGVLYNWPAAMDWDGVSPADPFELEGLQGACPENWHVPSDSDWMTLISYLGGRNIAGGKLKSALSDNPSWNGSNEVGFKSIPSGLRHSFGDFDDLDHFSYFWTSSLYFSSWVFYRGLNSFSSSIEESSRLFREGVSVRCILSI